MTKTHTKKRKVQWLTKDWLDRRDEFVSCVEPETLYMVGDVAKGLGIPDGTLTDHIHRHSSVELRQGGPRTIPGKELTRVLLRIWPAWPDDPERRIPRYSQSYTEPEPSPELKGPLDFMTDLLGQYPQDLARRMAFELARRFSRSK